MCVCVKKHGRAQQVKPISKHQIQSMKGKETVPNLQKLIWIQDKEFVFEVDTGALSPVTGHYEVGMLRQ